MKYKMPFFLALAGCIAVGCGSSSSSSGTGAGGTTETSKVKSITDLPAISTMVSTGTTSGSVSVAQSVGKTASGTAPLLTSISDDNIDSYFWNGLLAQIKSAGSATEAQRSSYWDGEGACRMAQTVGYAFQNILQGGTSLCYMQNAPKAANGVSVVSGDAENSTVFNQGASNKIVKVVVSNQEGMSGDENVFIKVYGTGSTEGTSGYAADLWFCSSANAVTGYEKIRLDDTTFTSTSVGNDFGNFVSTISAALTTDSSGHKIFDTEKSRSATVYFGPSDGSFTFLGSVAIDSNDLLTARDYQTGTFGGGSTQTSKHSIFANYTGSTMDTLRFSAASFSLQDNYGGSAQSITGATEYQDTHYVSVDTGSLLTKAQAEDFSNTIYKGDTSSYTTALKATADFSCTATPDVVVAMDFSQSGPKAVATLCENDFKEMDFCDGTAVGAVRNIVFANQGSCSTSFCTVGDDFSCQQWADNNIGNTEGITTANATCNSSGCCAKK